ncbi:MAG: DUF222 domain-containing protein [Acidimicrobiia bacterium]
MWSYGDTRDELDKLSDAQLCDYVTQMQAFEASAQAHKAAAHALITQRGCHCRDGSRTLNGWIQETGRHSRRHARTQVEIANAAADLPEIWARFADGSLSEDQMGILVRFATAETDAHWAGEAPKLSVRQLEVCARQHRRERRDPDPPDPDTPDPKPDPDPDGTETGPAEPPGGPEPAGGSEAPITNTAFFTPLPDGSGARLVATFDIATAAFVEAALRRQADTYPRNPDTDAYDPLGERIAWALFDLTTSTRRSNWADRAVVTIHADLATVAGLDDNDAVIDWPQPARVSADELRRLLHNAMIDTSLDDLAGRPIGIGHVTNHWPPMAQRRIQHRDRGCCRWPGCSNSIGLEIHHEPPYPQGPTDTFHGLLLCVHHHQCRTSRGFLITGNPEEELQFWRPDHTLIGATRPPLDPHLETLFCL